MPPQSKSNYGLAKEIMLDEIKKSNPEGFSYVGTIDRFSEPELKSRIFKDYVHPLVITLLELDEISKDVKNSASDRFYNFIHVFVRSENYSLRERVLSSIHKTRENFLERRTRYRKLEEEWEKIKYNILKPTMTLEETIDYESRL